MHHFDHVVWIAVGEFAAVPAVDEPAGHDAENANTKETKLRMIAKISYHNSNIR